MTNFENFMKENYNIFILGGVALVLLVGAGGCYKYTDDFCGFKMYGQHDDDEFDIDFPNNDNHNNNQHANEILPPDDVAPEAVPAALGLSKHKKTKKRRRTRKQRKRKTIKK